MMPGRRLLSKLDVRSRFAGFGYGDCGFWTRRRCGDGGYLVDGRLCSNASELLDTDGRSRNLSIRRGALVYSPAPYPDGSTSVYTGITAIELGRRNDLWRLRLYPRRAPDPAPLPAPRLPSWLWDALERTERSYERTHDESATARQLGLTRKDVHHRLRVAHRLRVLHVDGREDCARDG
jgi:hypothetical protein